MKRPRPDTRLDWRDPAMPVAREYIMRDGTKKGPYVDADYEHRYREFRMSQYNPDAPDWSKDPTYNLRRKKP